MSDEYITRHEHKEFAERMDAENSRLSHRILAVEETLKKVSDITVELKELAIGVKQMANELQKQGERLTAIEQKPAKRWDSFVTSLVTGLGGIVIGAVISALVTYIH